MINAVTLVGRLTRDPDLKYTPNGTQVTTFILAINRTFTNQQGERDADFIRVRCWGKIAENVANYLNKGQLCGVEGRIETSNYQSNDGKRVYNTEVIASSVQFLERKKSEEKGEYDAR